VIKANIAEKVVEGWRMDVVKYFVNSTAVYFIK
jgi:hypothetical protein